MAKKDDLKASLGRRPILKRAQPTDDAAINQAVDEVAISEGNTTTQVSEEKTAKPAKTSNKPTLKRQRSVKSKSATSGGGSPTKKTAADTGRMDKEREKEPRKRLTIDISAALHRKLKLHAYDKEIYIRDYVVQLIEEGLKKS